MNGVLREKKKKRIYKLYSEKIIEFLTEKGRLQLMKDGRAYNISTNEMSMMNKDDEILTDNINWIIRRMLREKLVKIYDNTISLATKGLNEVRYKKVSQKYDVIFLLQLSSQESIYRYMFSSLKKLPKSETSFCALTN